MTYKKNQRMNTSITFGDDGIIEVHNTAIGKPNDRCELDILVLRKIFEDGDVEPLVDRNLACDDHSPNLQIHTGQLSQSQTQQSPQVSSSGQHVHIKEGE